MEEAALAALAALVAFRDELYGCFGRRRDALFEVVDALLTAEVRPSLAHLSVAPLHQRGWGSVYAALRRGEVAGDALVRVLVRRAAETIAPAAPPDYAVDVSVWPRRHAETSPERGYCSFLGASRRVPVIEGWSYQWVVQLGPERDSWTAPVAVRRIRPTEKPTQVAAEQVRTVVADLQRLPAALAAGPPLFTFDAAYDAAHFTHALADVPAALLIRLRGRRRLFTTPPRLDPSAPRTRGRRPLRGARFVCADPVTWPTPTAEWRGTDATYGAVRVRACARARVRACARGEISGCRCAPHPRVGATTPGCTRAARRSAWRSSGSPGARPVPATRVHPSRRPPCGCGGRGRAARLPQRPGTSTAAGGRTCGASTSSRRSASSSSISRGRRHTYGCPSRPTAGAGSSRRPTPSSASPAAPSPTDGCPGSARSPRGGSLPPASYAILCHSPRACPRAPPRHNPAVGRPAGPKATARARHRATRQSRRPLEPSAAIHTHRVSPTRDHATRGRSDHYG